MKINVLFPHFGLRPAGGFRIIYQYMDILSSMGYEVCFIYPASVRKGFRAIFGYVRTLISLTNKEEWYFFENPIKKKYVLSLKEKNIPNGDICIATSCETAVFLNEYHKDKGGKIYFIQDFEVWSGKQKDIEATWCYNMKKIVISQHLLEIGYSLGIKDAVLIPNPINHSLFRVINPIEQREVVIGMLYSKAGRKGSIYGIEALCKVKEAYPGVQAVLFGISKRPNGLPSWIQYYQKPDQYFLVNEIYNRLSIFICSSLYEGWGLPGMEAMACGAALVTTDCGGIHNYAIHEKTALICEIGNSDALFVEIKRLIDDSNLRLRIVKRGLDKISEFSMEDSISKLEKVLWDKAEGGEIKKK